MTLFAGGIKSATRLRIWNLLTAPPFGGALLPSGPAVSAGPENAAALVRVLPRLAGREARRDGGDHTGARLEHGSRDRARFPRAGQVLARVLSERRQSALPPRWSGRRAALMEFIASRISGRSALGGRFSRAKTWLMLLRERAWSISFIAKWAGLNGTPASRTGRPSGKSRNTFVVLNCQ